MQPTKAIRNARLIQTLNRIGFTIEESLDLFKIERTLNRWHGRECNGEIYRDEKTGKVYSVFECHRRGPTRTRFPIGDMETAALRKLSVIMASKPALLSYVQTDPRGVALYILESKEIKSGYTIDECYSNGICVYNR